VTRAANRGVDARPVSGQCESGGSATAHGPDGQCRVVLASNSYPGCGQVLLNGCHIFRFDFQVRPLGVFTHQSRQGEQNQGNDDENAQHKAENIEKFAVLRAHDDLPEGPQMVDAGVYPVTVLDPNIQRTSRSHRRQGCFRFVTIGGQVAIPGAVGGYPGAE